MKTIWKILKLSHRTHPAIVLWISGFRVGEVRDGRMCIHAEVDTFTDETFLVVTRWKKLDSVELCS